jgi:hypothetical protein
MQFNRFLPKPTLTAFLLCLLLSIAANAQTTAPTPTVRARATFRSETFQYKLTDADFANTPSWNEAESEPPLSVKEAVRIARETAPRFVKGAEAWKVRRVELNMLGDKWFYRVQLFCTGTSCRELSERSFSVIVKMDGKIVEPKRIVVVD